MTCARSSFSALQKHFGHRQHATLPQPLSCAFDGILNGMPFIVRLPPRLAAL